MSMARYKEAALLFRKLLPFAQTLEEKLELYHKQAHCWALGGLGKEAVETAQTGIDLAKDIPLEELSKMEGHWYSALHGRVSEACVSLGEYERAITYARLAKEIQGNRFFDKNLEDSKGWKDYHLARALMYAGKYMEAERVIRGAIERFEQINSHWSANYAYDLLGQILINLGKYEEALELNARAAQILEPFYGKEHADTAKNLEYRGNIYAAMGQREKADGYYQQAIDIYRKLNCRKRAEEVQAKL